MDIRGPLGSRIRVRVTVVTAVTSMLVGVLIAAPARAETLKPSSTPTSTALVTPAPSKPTSASSPASSATPTSPSYPTGQNDAALCLTIQGLPPELAAGVTITGPGGFTATATASRTFKNLAPGTYTIASKSVAFPKAISDVPAGSKAYPNDEEIQVAVVAHKSAHATVDYGNIVSSRVRSLTPDVLALTGKPTDPRTVTVAKAGHPTVGQIVIQVASQKLPAGLLHKVTAVTVSGKTARLTVTPAHLIDAFPQIDFDQHIDLQSSDPVKAKVAAAALPAAELGLKMGNFTCQVPVSDSSITMTDTVTVGTDVAMDVPKRWGVPVGLPYGKIAMTVGVSRELAMLLRKNLGCTASVTLLTKPGVIQVGPVPVPVFFQLGAGGSLKVGAGDLTGNAAAGFSVTGGLAFNGTRITNLSTSSGSGSVSLNGAGKVSLGPTFKFAIGVPSVVKGVPNADVNLALNPSLALTGNTNGTCTLDLVGTVQVGVQYGPIKLNQPLITPTKNLYKCPTTPPTGTTLAVQHTAPLGAFPNQTFPYTVKVTNNGSQTATGVTVAEVLPSAGTFVSSSPSGTPSAPAPNATYSVPLGDIPVGQSKTVVVNWKAPANAASLTAIATATATNAPTAGPVNANTPVGTALSCNPCGATAKGTGLRNRDHGAVTISDVPAGASVGRAVLVWGLLYSGAQPANTITFAGHPVTADVTSTVSGNLCWGDTNTVGYAADVTSYVTGNGTYDITDPIRGVTRPDSEPAGVLPYTDGATLLVFYNGGGANNQVLSDFSYDTNTDTDQAIDRSFTGIHSIGGASTLTLAGPDGQNYDETFTLTGADTQILVNTWDGSDPQDGPSFAIGNLWDTDVHDISSILPAGQSELSLHSALTEDCIGVGAAVLQTSQG